TRAAELLDRPKDHVHIAGVLAQQHAFELERVLFMAGVAHFAQAIHALVSVDPNDWVIVVACDHCDAHVGDLKVARPRESANSLLDVLALGRIFRDVRHYLLLCYAIGRQGIMRSGPNGCSQRYFITFWY